LFEKQRAELETRNVAERGKAEALAKKLDKATLVIIRQASDAGHLYGSVTARDVADAGKEANQPIERAQVYIDTPIKALGLYDVKVKLHPEVSIKLKINVARSAEEAVVQAEKGAAVIKAAAEKAEVVAAFGAPEEVAEGEAKPAKKKKAKADDAETTGEAEEPKAKKPRAKKTAEA
jgi:large subunit ribosomal protein L9